MRSIAVVALLLAGLTPAGAQVVSRPTDRPIVSAENESWYRLREPLLFAGDAYYPVGAPVFFNGNTMVRTGHYNGVPLYADTTIEPYSIVYVPVRGGLMQPYERVRRGELAGSAGSRTPSFPVRSGSEPDVLPAAAAPPTGVPLPVGAISAFTSETRSVATTSGTPAAAAVATPPAAVGTAGTISSPRQTAEAVATIRPAENNDGVWLRFMGGKWVSAGPAVLLRESEFMRIGEYNGFPVFARTGVQEDRIYLPSSEGLIAPFKRKE